MAGVLSRALDFAVLRYNVLLIFFDLLYDFGVLLVQPANFFVDFINRKSFLH
ncbi:hypothetical protein D3C84_1233210 [compost metagenome]